MPINQIQFQIGLSLVELLKLLKLFKDENFCRTYIRKQKWPEGFRRWRCSYERSLLQIQGIRETHECCVSTRIAFELILFLSTVHCH